MIGGERYNKAFDGTQYTVPGSGSLGGGNYAGHISLGTNTILDFNTSANQTLSGIISGTGSVVKEIAGSTLTLTGVNTYTGNTTVSGGTLELASSAGLSFAVTNTTANKITGAGTATLNGTFTIDTSAVTVSIGSWPLVDTTTKSFGGTFGVAGFTGPVGTVFTKVVDASRTWTFDTSTGVLSFLTKSVFTSFAFNGIAGTIDNNASTIFLPVAHGTVLATVAPAFTATSGTCNQTGGSPPSPIWNGSNQATYTLTDGITVHNFTVTLNVLPAPPAGVGSGLRLWLAGDGVIANDAKQVRVVGADKFITQWNDSSGHNNNATNLTLSDQPVYITGALNGKPVLRFTQDNEDTGDRLYLGDLSAQFGGPVPDPTPTATNSGTGGASLNGTYANTPTRGVAGALAGDSDTAATFNGSNQNVDIPYNAQLNTTIFSAEIWAKPANSNANQAIFSSGQPAAGSRTGWVLYQLNGSSYSFRPFKNNSNLTVTGTANGIGDSVASVVTVGQWQHIVVVNDGTNCILYVNGVSIASAPSATYVAAADGGTTLGKRYGGALNFFTGLLDEAAFYTTALSPADVLAHYQNGINPSPSPSYATLVGTSSPVGYYRLNEPAAPGAAPQTATIFAVATINSDTRYNVFGNRDNDDRWRNNSEAFPGSFRGGRASGTFTSATWPTTGSHIISLESSAAQYRGVIDGTEVGTDTGDYNSGTGQNWTIANRATSGQQLNGDIAELIIYNRILTTQEANQVGTYLANKYGLSTAYPPATDYANWTASYLPADVSNPAADYDGDGLTNQQEYAFGLNPTLGSSANPITEPLDKATGVFKYTRRATPATSQLTYTVLTSTNLSTWTPDAGAAESITTSGGVETVTFTLSPGLLGAPRLFVRVEASPTP